VTLSGAELKRLVRLHQKKHRERERLFLAEGANLVNESPEPPRRLVTEPEDVKRLSALDTPTGPVAVFPFLDVPAGELLRQRERVLLLDGVQDPGNVGTAIRAAHAFGAGVALSKGTADLYNPKTVRATMGSLFHAPISRGVETLTLLKSARGSGFATVAAVPAGGEPPRSMPAGKLVIVVGSEGAGLPEDVVAACDARATIPALAASLNAAVAAAILLHESYGLRLR